MFIHHKSASVRVNGVSPDREQTVESEVTSKTYSLLLKASFFLYGPDAVKNARDLCACDAVHFPVHVLLGKKREQNQRC